MNDINRKNSGILKRVTLFLIVFFVGMEGIYAITQFPDTINISVGALFPNNFRIFKKSYVGSDGSSGKAFCSSFWNDVYNTCNPYVKTYYSSDSATNEKVQASIGAMINKGRNSDGSMTWDNYYYTELAINQFLYNKGIGNAVNNLNRYGSFTKWNSINPILNVGNSVYDTYKQGKIVISNLKVNNVPIGETSKEITPSESGSYIVTAQLKCYSDNAGKKQVACSNITAKLKSIKNNNELLHNVSQTYSGNTVNLRADISNIVKSDGSEQAVMVNFLAENKKTYYLAQRYRSSKCSYVQTMTPNLLKPYTVSATTNIVGNFTIKSNNKGCGDEIQLPNGRDLSYAVANSELYKAKYGRNDIKDNFEMLLDINNPSCSSISPSASIKCSEEDGNTVKVNTKEIRYDYVLEPSGTEIYDYMCTVNFQYDSNTLINSNISNVDKLIYERKDGIIGTAHIIYDCNVPALAMSRTYNNANYKNKDFTLETIVPDMNIKIFTDSKEVEGSYDILNKVVSVQGYESDCEVVDNKTVQCSNYNNAGHGYGWKFDAEIQYYYSDSNKYYLDRNGKIMKAGTCTNCSELGYGIYVPKDAKIGDGNSEVSFEFPSGYKINTDNKLSTTCPYKVEDKVNDKKDILYRTIDTDKPFLRASGNQRYTGANWCGDEVSNDASLDFGVDNSKVVVDNSGIDATEAKSSSCIYKGDVNRNGEWDENDIELLQGYTVERYDFDDEQIALSDLNGDNRITISDVTELQKYVFRYNQIKKGDVNLDGVIDENDSMEISKYKAELVTFSELQKKLADLDNNCIININDSTIVQKIIAGHWDALNATSSTDSGYSGDEADGENYEVFNDAPSSNDNERTKKCVGNDNNNKVRQYISNRPTSNGDIKIKTEDGSTTKKKIKTPLYRFELTPDNIKKIRSDYNRKKTYSDFESVCDAEKENCVSTFISQAKAKKYVQNVSGLCTPGTYCDIKSVIEESYIKGGA